MKLIFGGCGVVYLPLTGRCGVGISLGSMHVAIICEGSPLTEVFAKRFLELGAFVTVFSTSHNKWEGCSEINLDWKSLPKSIRRSPLAESSDWRSRMLTPFQLIYPLESKDRDTFLEADVVIDLRRGSDPLRAGAAGFLAINEDYLANQVLYYEGDRDFQSIRGKIALIGEGIDALNCLAYFQQVTTIPGSPISEVLWVTEENTLFEFLSNHPCAEVRERALNQIALIKNQYEQFSSDKTKDKTKIPTIQKLSSHYLLEIDQFTDRPELFLTFESHHKLATTRPFTRMVDHLIVARGREPKIDLYLTLPLAAVRPNNSITSPISLEPGLYFPQCPEDVEVVLRDVLTFFQDQTSLSHGINAPQI